MAIQTQHVVMGKHILASGSLAGEMKVQAISGSTGLTLNQMLVKLSDVNVDDRALIRSQYIAADAVIVGDAASAYNTLGKIEDVVIANDAALRGDSAVAYNTLGKIEDFIIALQADVDQNESDSDAGEGTIATNLSNLSGGLDGRLDVLEAGAGSAGSVAKAQADAQAFATSAISDLVAGAPAALDTLNELAAAINDDAGFHTTITNALTARQTELDAIESAMGPVMSAAGAYVAHSGKNYINGNSTVTEDLIDLDAQLKGVADAGVAVQSEVDAIEGAMGAVMSSAGAYVAHTGKNYINGNSDVTGDLIDLDAQIKLVRDELTTNGFHTEKDGAVWKMGWGLNSPRLSFAIEADASVTMSVDKET